MLQTHLGASVKVAPSLAPIAGTGSAQNGASVDRIGYLSAIGVMPWTTSGGVTGGTVLGKFQHSDDGSTNWTDFGDSVSVAIPAGPNATGVAEIPVNLTGAKRYVRGVVDSDPTGGSPASIVAFAIVLGGASNIPAV